MNNKKIVLIGAVILFLILNILIFLKPNAIAVPVSEDNTPGTSTENPTESSIGPTPLPPNYIKDQEEKKKLLEEIGLQISPEGEEGLKLDDFEISDDKLFLLITKKGAEKQIDVSKIELVIIKIPNGGKIRDSQDYYEFAENDLGVGVRDGKLEIVGQIELKKATINNIEYIPENGRTFFYDDNNDITTGDNEVVLKNSADGKIIGRLKGKAFVSDIKSGRVELQGQGETPSVFINEKGTKFELTGYSSATIEYNGDLIINSNEQNYLKITAKDGDYENIFVKPIKRNFKNIDLGIKAGPDEVPADSDPSDSSPPNIPPDSNTPSTDNIGDSSPPDLDPGTEAPPTCTTSSCTGINPVPNQGQIDLILEKQTEEGNEQVKIKFSEDNLPLVEGGLTDLKSNIGTFMKELDSEEYTPWLLYRGEEVSKEIIGKINENDVFSFVELDGYDELKKFVIKSMIETDITDSFEFKDSAIQHLTNKGEIKDYLVEKVIEREKDADGNLPSSVLGSLIEINQNDLDMQKKLVKESQKTIYKGLLFEDIHVLSIIGKNPELFIEENIIFSPSNSKKILDSMKDHPNYDIYQKKIIEKTDGPLDFEAFSKLSNEDKLKALDEINFYSEFKLLKSLKSSDSEEVQKKVIEKMKYDIISGIGLVDILVATKNNPNIKKDIWDMYRFTSYERLSQIKDFSKDLKQPTDIEDIKDWQNIRRGINELELEDIQKILEISSEYFKEAKEDPSFDPKDMAELLSTNEIKNFYASNPDLDNAEKWSIALGVNRWIKQQGKEPTSQNINEATQEILANRDKDFEILGEETDSFIIVANDEIKKGKDVFPIQDLKEMGIDSGVEENKIKSFKGVMDNSKEKILDIVEKEFGKRTLLFSGHGGSNHLSLTEDVKSSNLHDSHAISYKELGDALIKNSNLNGLTLVLDACNTYDYKDNLLDYLSKNGDGKLEGTMYVVTSSNRNSPSRYNKVDNIGEDFKFETRFTKGLIQEKEYGKPITLNTIYKSEKHYFDYEDASVTKVVFTKDSIKTITTGSSIDELNPSSSKSKTSSDSKKPLIIEVAYDQQQFNKVI